MSSIISETRDRLYAQADTAIPALTMIANVSAMERINWRVLIEKAEQSLGGGIVPPWGVFVWGGWSEPEETYGVANTVFESIVEFYYITELAVAGVAKTDVAMLTEIEDALIALVDSVRSETGATAKYSCLTHGISIADDLEPNDYFLGANVPFYAGRARFRILTGK